MSELKQMIDYDFRGGLNTDKSPDKLSKKELTQAENVVLDERGSAKTREGIKCLNEGDKYSEELLKMMEWSRADGSISLMCVFKDNTYTNYEGRLYEVDKETGGRYEIQKVYKSDIAYFSFNDTFYFLDQEELYKYDGSSSEVVVNRGTIEPVSADYHHGMIFGPLTDPERYSFNLDQNNILEDSLSITAPMAIEDSTGDPVPSMEYFNADGSDDHTWDTGFNDYVEGEDYYVDYENGEIYAYKYNQRTGDPGLLYDRFAHNQDEIYGNDGYYIYGDWYISYDYDSNPPDPSKIRKCKYALRHTKSNRTFYAGNPNDVQALYYSAYNQPADTTAGDVVYPDVNEGPITGLIEFLDAVLVFYKHSVWVWKGVDPSSDATWQKIPVPQGAYSQDAICLTPNSITYFGPGGLYVLKSSALGSPTQLEASNIVMDITRGRVSKVIKDKYFAEEFKMTFDSKNNRLLLVYSEGDESKVLDKILVYDWNLQAFSTFAFNGSYFTINDLLYTIDDQVLLGVGFSLLELDDDLTTDNFYPNDDGTTTGLVSRSIKTRLKTKEYLFKTPFENKLIKKIYSSVANIDSNVDYFDYYLNLINNLGTEEVNVWYPSYEYEKNIGENDIEKINYNEKCNKLQLKIESSQAIKISGFKIIYKLVNTVGSIN